MRGELRTFTAVALLAVVLATADLVVWSADLHRLPPVELCDAFPRLTVLEGEVVHEASSSISPPRGTLSLSAGGAVAAPCPGGAA